MTGSYVPLAPRVLLGFSLLLAASLALIAPVDGSAAGIQANLRVVTWKGKIVFDGQAEAATSTIKPAAGCLSGSAGPARTVEGARAITLLNDAAMRSRALRPLRLSDGDWGFGICGIAGITARNKEWWEIRSNYRSAQLGIEALEVKPGDSILLYLSRSWEKTSPDALYLKAPVRVKRGRTIRIRAFSIDPATGRRTPVRGVRVKGAGRRTNAKGYTRIRVNRKLSTVARKHGLVPSNRVVIGLR